MKDINDPITSQKLEEFKTNFEYLLFKVGSQLQDKSMSQLQKFYLGKYLNPRKYNYTKTVMTVKKASSRLDKGLKDTPESNNKLTALLACVNTCIEKENMAIIVESRSFNPHRITVQSLLCNS